MRTYEEKVAYLERLNAERERKHEAKLNYARENFDGMLEYVMKDEKTGEKIRLSEIHRTWIRHIETCWERELHACILAPYGAGKSAIIAIGLPLFLVGRDHTLRIKVVSANDDLARQRIGLQRRYIESDPDYRELFPHIVPSETQDWTKSKLFLERGTLAKDATVEAKGITSSAIGARCDVMLLDDVNDARNTLHQPRLRSTVWTQFTGAFMSRLDPGGRIAAIATRWHVEDIPGRILKDENMRKAWGFLIQRVSQDFTRIECEYFYGRPEGTPLTHKEILTRLSASGTI